METGGSPFIYIYFLRRLSANRLSCEACVCQQPLSLTRERLRLGVERNLEQTSCFLSGVAKPTPKATNTLCPLRLQWEDSNGNRAGEGIWSIRKRQPVSVGAEISGAFARMWMAVSLRHLNLGVGVLVDWDDTEDAEHSDCLVDEIGNGFLDSRSQVSTCEFDAFANRL